MNKNSLQCYRVSYASLINVPCHKALHYILYHSWEETMSEYTWLTMLITYINNGSNDAKQYLITCGVHSQRENDMIADMCRIQGLNMNRISSIISFVRSVGTYFKHGTYVKWYKKELGFIETFATHKDKTVEDFIQDINEPIKKLLTEYYITKDN